jgi:hypothetical protein
MKFVKGSDEWQFFQDFWNYAQVYYEPNDSDEYWDGIMADGNKLMEKYSGKRVEPLVKKLLFALFDYAGDELKRKEQRDVK